MAFAKIATIQSQRNTELERHTGSK